MGISEVIVPEGSVRVIVVLGGGYWRCFFLLVSLSVLLAV